MKAVFLQIIFFFHCFIGFGQAPQEISGKVTQMGYPLANVNIFIDQTGEGTFTNSSGIYKIKAQPGSTLLFSYTGMLPIKIIVEDVTKVLNVDMEPEITALEGVTISKKKLSRQEELAKNYRSDRNIMKTRFGYTDTKRSSTKTILIDENMIRSSGGLDLVGVIEGRFIGIIDKTDPLKPRFYDRRTSTITENYGETLQAIEGGRKSPQTDSGQGKEAMIFDVDGQVFENYPNHITGDMVDRIAIIPGNAAANIYSMRARGGVIVVNTKGANVVYEQGSSKVFDYEQLRNNFYRADTIAVNSNSNMPKYMQELQQAANSSEAQKIYEEQTKRYGASPYFKLNVADHFLNGLNEYQMADDIYEEVASEFSENAVVLKALAYLRDERKEWDKSTDLYKKILRLRPKYAQSYRDLANGFSQSTNYAEALGMYVRYGKVKELNPAWDLTTGIDSIVESEYENISGLYGQQVFKNNTKKSNTVWGARVLVEWNNSEAEFELQIIHPNTQFFTIDHTNSGSAKRIENEKKKGYSSEQIWFDYTNEGAWNVNLRYLGNKSYNPTYFKITLYKNWGLPNQSKEIKVYRMVEKNQNRNLLKFSVTRNTQ
ncbi:MAG: carboxypeptidase-like regulatory domain-containing protein [Maribacter sp.]